MGRSRKTANLIDVPVAFKGVSIGDETARLGVAIARNDMTISVADKNLCGRRLTGTVIAKPAGDGADQGTFEDMAEDRVLSKVSFDVKKFSVSAKLISFGLTFAIKGLDIDTLAHFAKRNGRFQVTEVEAIPDGADDGDEDEEGDDEE